MPPPAPGRSAAARFWIGAALSVPVSMLVFFAAVLVNRAGGGDLLDVVIPVTGLVILGGAVAGIAASRTRWYVLGGLAGAAILAILLAVTGALVFFGFVFLWLASGAH